MFRIVPALVILFPATGFAADVPLVAADQGVAIEAPPPEFAWSDHRTAAVLRALMTGIAQGRHSTETNLEFFQKLANRRRGGPITEQAQQLAKIARKNLAEERERPEACLRVLFAPTTRDRVADLIYYLRYSPPTNRDFNPERPIHLERLLSLDAQRPQLRDSSRLNVACWLGDLDAVDALGLIGADAVPQLLEALGDETLLRRSWCNDDFCAFNRTEVCLPRLGDAAACALNAIAGRQVVETPFVEKGNVAEARRTANDWWKKYQRKGEQQMLIEGVELADHFSPLQAAMLVRRYPRSALPALRRTIEKLAEPEARYQIVRLVQFIPGAEAERFLLEQLSAKGPGERLAAATALWARKQAPQALATVIKDWRAFKLDDERDTWQSRSRLLEFLVQSHEAAAIEELTRAFRGRNDPGRIEFVRRLAQEAARSKSFSEDALAELERLFLLGLDVAWEEGEHGRFDGGFRCADWAAVGLCRIWNMKAVAADDADLARCGVEPYPPCTILLEGERPTYRARLRQIALVRNEWRKRQGLSPLPKQEFPRAASVKWTVIEPLLRRFTDEKTDEGRQAVAAKILALGIGAVPRINQFLEQLNDDHPAQRQLEALAGRLSFAISDIRTLDHSMELPDDLRAELDQWRGKAPTANEFEQLADYFRGRTPSGVVGRLLIERPDDGSGAVIWVAWRPSQPARQGYQSQYSICVRNLIDFMSSWENTQFVDGGGRSSARNWNGFSSAMRLQYRRSTKTESLIAISSLIPER